MPRVHSTRTLFPMQSSGQTTPLLCSWHEPASSSTMLRSCNSSISQNGHVHAEPTLVRSSPARSPGLERLPAQIRSGNPVERKGRLHDTSHTRENMCLVRCSNPVSGTKVRMFPISQHWSCDCTIPPEPASCDDLHSFVPCFTCDFSYVTCICRLVMQFWTPRILAELSCLVLKAVERNECFHKTARAIDRVSRLTIMTSG